MCDCYHHPCAVRGCKLTIPWHIGDYKFPRDAFAIWCPKHEMLAPLYAHFFTRQDDEEDKSENDVLFGKGSCVAAIGPELGLGERDGDNGPNFGDEFVVSYVPIGRKQDV